MWLDNLSYIEIGLVCAYSLYNLTLGPARHDSKTGKLRTLLFPTIMILIQTALLKSLYRSFPHPFALEVVYMYFSFAYFAMMITYTRGKLSNTLLRILVDIPSSWFFAVVFFHWVAYSLLSLVYPVSPQWTLVVSAVIWTIGLYHSMHRPPFEKRHIVIDRKDVGPKLTQLQGYKFKTDPALVNVNNEMVLKICQVTDPHLGPFNSIKRLHSICEKIVAEQPDLIFLTGDFFTMQAHHHPGALVEALAPLKPYAHKTVACLGNHDYEAISHTVDAMKELKIPLLIDEELVLQTRIGKVQVLGSDFHFRDVKPKMEQFIRNKPRRSDCISTILLLHNPFHFKFVPEGYADIVLSGHLHGGQLGFLTWGIDATVFSVPRMLGVKVAEQGYWAQGTKRIYVHRGTGYYGFPLRLGVPNEESMLHLIYK
jgi:predicted MPP superfamily phosphohydrolase